MTFSDDGLLLFKLGWRPLGAALIEGVGYLFGVIPRSVSWPACVTITEQGQSGQVDFALIITLLC